MLEKIVIFISFLAPLIFFHELGHFFFARFFGVRVEIFSIGFGPKLFKWKKNGTEYALSLIPLGGYVKMFGDDSLGKEQIKEEDRQFAFNHKGKWARFWIVFGGPLANFVMAFVLFFLLAMTGEKAPESRFSFIAKDTYFHKLGIRTGDLLLKINQKEIVGLADLIVEDDDIESVTVGRKDKAIILPIKSAYKDFVEQYMQINPRNRAPVLINQKLERYALSTSDKDINWETSLDEILETNSSIYLYKITNPGKLENEKYVAGTDSKKIELSTNNAELKTRFLDLKKLGFFPMDLAISSIVMGSPADKIQLKQNDIILGLNGQYFEAFEDFRAQVQKTEINSEVSLEILRDGKVSNFKLIPELKEINGEKIKSIGIYSSVEFNPVKFVDTKGKGFFESIIIGFEKTVDTTLKTFEGFKKIISNEISVKNIGGPLAIGKAASDFLDISISYFFRLMALISINLAVINLFPIPVLDGGHILFLIFEFFNKGPLSKKKLVVAQQFGLIVLFSFLSIALFNDFSRFLK